MILKARDKQHEMLHVLKSVYDELEVHFKEQNLKLKEAKKECNEMNGDQELDFLFKRLRLFFDTQSLYLNINRPILIPVDIPKEITWDFVLTELENYMRY